MSGCMKMAFQSRAYANAHARHSHKHGATGNLRAYLCPRCGSWHLTSMTKRAQRVATRRGRAA